MFQTPWPFSAHESTKCLAFSAQRLFLEGGVVDCQTARSNDLSVCCTILDDRVSFSTPRTTKSNPVQRCEVDSMNQQSSCFFPFSRRPGRLLIGCSPSDEVGMWRIVDEMLSAGLKVADSPTAAAGARLSAPRGMAAGSSANPISVSGEKGGNSWTCVVSPKRLPP